MAQKTPKQKAAIKAFTTATDKARKMFNAPGNKKTWAECVKACYQKN